MILDFDSYIINESSLKKLKRQIHGVLDRSARKRMRKELRGNIVTFKFKKRNGEIRTAHGTLHPDYLPKLRGGSPRPEHQMVYYDLDKEGWRSFRSYSFIKILNLKPVDSKTIVPKPKPVAKEDEEEETKKVTMEKEKEEVKKPIHKEEDEKKGKGSSVKFSFQKTHSMQLTLTRSLRRSSTFGSKRIESEKKSETVAEPVKEVKKEEEEVKKEEVKEPSEFTVLNGNRITKQQMKDLVLPNQPYHFLLDPLQVKENDSVMGIMIVRKNPDHYVSYLDLKHDDGLPEQKCPEPFIYEIPPEPISN